MLTLGSGPSIVIDDVSEAVDTERSKLRIARLLLTASASSINETFEGSTVETFFMRSGPNGDFL